MNFLSSSDAPQIVEIFFTAIIIGLESSIQSNRVLFFYITSPVYNKIKQINAMSYTDNKNGGLIIRSGRKFNIDFFSGFAWKRYLNIF